MKRTHLRLITVALLVSFLLAACGSPLTASSWPGVSADGDLSYVAAGTQVFAVRVSDGTLAWKYPEKADAKKGFYSNPVITPDGQLLLASYDHLLHSINPQTGQPNSWSFTAGDRLVGNPLVTEAGIFQPAADHKLYALDFQGKTRWIFEARKGMWSAPVTDGEILYLTSMDHYLYAIDPENGRKQWETDLGAAITASPAISEDGILYVGSLGKEMLAIDSQNGRILWRTGTDGASWSTPMIHETSLYFGDTSGTIYILDAKTGAIRNQIVQDGPIVGRPAAIPDGLVFTTEKGSVVALDYEGKSLWNRTINGKLYTGPVAAGEKLLVALTQADSLLVSFDPNGNQGWTFAIPKE